MNKSYQHQNQATYDQFGSRVAARLADTTDNLPYEITERLRAARVRALGHRKIATAYTASSVSKGAGTLTLGCEHLSGWGRLAAAAPLVALVLGLIVITIDQNDNRANELAEIDSALLTDDLPPAAYADPGFSQFLKMRSQKGQ